MNKKTEKKQANGSHMIQGAGPGRPKGMKNTITKQMVEDVFQAYQDEGGVEYLRTMAREDRKLFAAMLMKIIPSKMESEHSGTLTVDSMIEAFEDIRHGNDSEEG